MVQSLEDKVVGEFIYFTIEPISVSELFSVVVNIRSYSKFVSFVRPRC